MKFKNQGFTLIELLVVISIIGLLSSIVLASVSEVRTKAGIAKLRQDSQSLINALELYYSKNNNYPPPAIGTPPYYSNPSDFEPHLSSEISSFVPNIDKINGITLWKRSGISGNTYTYIYTKGYSTQPYPLFCEGSSLGKEPYILFFGVLENQRSKLDGKFPKYIDSRGNPPNQQYNITGTYYFYCLGSPPR